ncbi:hypothetical protein HQ576_11970 [bacterium]|nr:hypothetical protein [bacterium]
MTIRDTSVLAIGVTLLLATGHAFSGSEADDALRKAKRATSYVMLAETVSRVSLQVGGMTDREPFDKALAWYARSLGRLHVQLYDKLTPPEGVESLHAKYKSAVAEFAQMAEAHYKADYPTARKHREKCVKEFIQAVGQLAKLKRDGVMPSVSHGGGRRD